MKSSNICGNCNNFKPKSGDRFFNCTFAQQGGVRYGMQVRADTVACEAFFALEQRPKPQPAAKATPPRKQAERPPRLCNWGRVVVIAAIVLLILLLAVGAYICVRNRAEPTPTTTPTPVPTETAPPPTGIRPTPTPTPTPIPINYYQLGDTVASAPYLIGVTTAERTTTVMVPGPLIAPAGTVWVIVTATITNGGTSAMNVQASMFSITDKFGLVYPPRSPPGALFTGAFPYQPTSINPGRTASGRIIYNLPEASTEMNVVLFVNGQFLAWVLPF